jgi:hypothetical protein
MALNAAQRAKVRRLTAQLATLGATLPGTISRREIRCGKPNCRCHADPPQLHGPYWWWTRSIRGKTVTRMLSEDLYHDYQTLFDDQQRARRVLSELEAIGLAALESDPRYGQRRGRGPTTPLRPVENPRSRHR